LLIHSILILLMNSFSPTTCTLLMLTSGVASLHGFLIQDFEVDTTGVAGLSSGAGEDSANPGTQNPVRVLSNAGEFLPNVETSSSGGSAFLEVRMIYEDRGGFAAVQGDRVVWNDGAKTGGFESGFGHSVDVYFDDPNAMLDAEDGGGNAYYAGDGFYLQTMLLDDTNGVSISGGGFGVRMIDDGALKWSIGADGNAKGYAGATAAGSALFETGVAGWFTLSTVWVENMSGGVDEVNTIKNTESGAIILTQVFEGVLDDIADAGQVGQATLGNGDLDAAGVQAGPNSFIGAVGIDNVSVVPEPRIFALFLGLATFSMVVIRRRRRS
jgi:hypothetical protein